MSSQDELLLELRKKSTVIDWNIIKKDVMLFIVCSRLIENCSKALFLGMFDSMRFEQ